MTGIAVFNQTHRNRDGTGEAGLEKDLYSTASAGLVTYLSAKYGKEFLPMGKTIHRRAMKIMDICPEYIVCLIRNGFPHSSQLWPTHMPRGQLSRAQRCPFSTGRPMSAPTERPHPGCAAWAPSVKVTGSTASGRFCSLQPCQGDRGISEPLLSAQPAGLEKPQDARMAVRSNSTPPPPHPPVSTAQRNAFHY